MSTTEQTDAVPLSIALQQLEVSQVLLDAQREQPSSESLARLGYSEQCSKGYLRGYGACLATVQKLFDERNSL